ncbi:GNAT family N-acetyltransferase [Paenibacillus sp. CGMCC 1.16610]|uniref:GNAT family N-acetyltransferase n=1 Tax=Paenibacillus anseongense TaxID=2682845 RepID=A0ABW9U2C0_9BACL|nr:GNAT family N-acetyltransferase [Paenibacillus sp. CGMCC 1.16610]MVQ34202.1 GNAT family N-acetyltransferase [Paenibacillus anseongense]
MEDNLLKQGIFARAGLSPQELKEVRDLWETCNRHDHIEIKLNWGTLSDRPPGVTNDFLFYRDDRIVGFLAIYSFLSTEVEISGMVHPEARNQGIFGQLVQTALETCRSRGVPKAIFINERGSASGKAFLTKLGADYQFSEYVMELQEGAEVVAQNGEELLTLRSANVEDTELLVQLNMSGFNMPEADTREYVNQTITGDKEKTWIAELGHGEQKVPIGKIGAMIETDASGFIYGFCVLPERRGQGYGRVILSQTIGELKMKHRAGLIKLEVSVENEKALGLYESCGFRTKNANDYYVLMLDQSE